MKLNWSAMSADERDALVWCDMTDEQRTSIPKWTRIPNRCAACGLIFTARRIDLKLGKMKYCSVKCSQIASRRHEVLHFNGKDFYYNKANGYYSSIDQEKMHHAVWKFFHKSEIPNGFLVHHIDGNKTNNSLENLELMEWGGHTSHHNTGKCRSVPRKPCSEIGCARISKARGLCTMHYQRAVSKTKKSLRAQGVDIE